MNPVLLGALLRLAQQQTQKSMPMANQNPIYEDTQTVGGLGGGGFDTMSNIDQSIGADQYGQWGQPVTQWPNFDPFAGGSLGDACSGTRLDNSPSTIGYSNQAGGNLFGPSIPPLAGTGGGFQFDPSRPQMQRQSDQGNGSLSLLTLALALMQRQQQQQGLSGGTPMAPEAIVNRASMGGQPLPPQTIVNHANPQTAGLFSGQPLAPQTSVNRANLSNRLNGMRNIF